MAEPAMASVFGRDVAPICLECYREEFEALSVPHGEEGDLFKECWLNAPKTCGRCYSGALAALTRAAKDGGFCDTAFSVGLDSPYRTVRIVLPADFIAQISVLEGLAQAHVAYGTKGQNAELQLTHNAKYHYDKNSHLARAVRTVGVWAVHTEVNIRAPNLLQVCSYVFCGTDTGRTKAWRTCTVEPVAIPVKQKVRKTEGPTQPALPSEPIADQAALDAELTEARAGSPLVSEISHAALPEGTSTTSQIPLVESASTTVPLTDDGEYQAGLRVAHQRFPSMAEDKQRLFANDPRNLCAALTLRRDATKWEHKSVSYQIGEDTASDAEKNNTEAVINAFKDKVFTRARCRQAAGDFTSTRDHLPKKMAEERRVDIEMRAQDPPKIGIGHTDAFIKAEVTGKPNPRPVANHGEFRQYGMAKVAHVFEKVMYGVFHRASIKHCSKATAVTRIFKDLGLMRHGDKAASSAWMESDGKAFEFGIHERLKAAELAIIRHVASHLGYEAELDKHFVDRVFDERTQDVTWVMRYTDESGEKCTFKLALGSCMRESGDRLTSSGNFFQLLIAQIEYFIHPTDYAVFIEKFVKNHGGVTKYKAAADSRLHSLGVGLEGDDMILRTTQTFTLDHYLAFFARRGWYMKVKFFPVGQKNVVTFVGYQGLVSEDGTLAFDGDVAVISPEIKRCLKTKAYTTTTVPEEVRPHVEYVNACVMAEQFRFIEPLHAFWSALAADVKPAELVDDKALHAGMSVLRDAHFRVSGEPISDEDVRRHFKGIVPCPAPGLIADVWREYAALAAGECSDLEWSLACGISTLGSNGDDLRVYLPAAWLA